MATTRRLPTVTNALSGHCSSDCLRIGRRFRVKHVAFLSTDQATNESRVQAPRIRFSDQYKTTLGRSKRHVTRPLLEKQSKRVIKLASPASQAGDDPELDSARNVRLNLASKGILFDQDRECTIDPFLLRDACECPHCVDESTRQRNFLFHDIPYNIRAVSQGTAEDMSWKVTWQNDIPGNPDHVSRYAPDVVKYLAGGPDPSNDVFAAMPPDMWNKNSIASSLVRAKHIDFMNEDISLARVLKGLRQHGLVFLSDVPSDPDAVRQIVERIGPIRNTFYGTTWDVRSVVNANNVAYTSKHLGFHMDLLYMQLPPAFQFLHCIHNSCQGGESRFVDTWNAVEVLRETRARHIAALKAHRVAFHYRNNGHHYRRIIPILRENPFSPRSKAPWQVSWSPPFVERILATNPGWSDRRFINAAKSFADTLEREDLVFETKMEEGTCVIFDNTRVCHARNAFDTSEGQRWLRGAYLDRCDLNSRIKSLRPQLMNL